MKPDHFANAALLPNMAEATRLTRAGRLSEASALIQAALAGHPSRGAGPTPPGPALDLVPERPRLASTPPGPAAKARPARPLPSDAGKPGSFTEQTYTSPAGTLAYRLYVPAGATAGMPLVVMLHGCTQSPEDFARGTGMNRLADALGFFVAYPRQSRAANSQKCWNWFRPGDQQRDRGEPALIAGATRQVIAAHRADPGRVYVAGLSAGGAAAAVMAAAYPDLYAAVGVHSGLACGAARDLPGALGAMKNGGGRARPVPRAGRFVPVITFHGDRDATVDEINSREIVAAAAAAAAARGALQTRSEASSSRAGRRYTREISTDAAGLALIERWTIHGAGHAWSGGDSSGSYTDPGGPDASREMLRFFLQHRLAAAEGPIPTP